MDKTFKDYIELLKEEAQTNQSVLVEGFQNAMNDGLGDPNQWLGDEGIVPDGEYDPNAMFDPGIEMSTSMTVEQKKTLLIDYYSELIEKVKVVRDHIDLISFDTLLDGSVIGISEIQFGLEELRVKIEKYIEDQYLSDKYERALYLYLSFMEELKLITKLLNRQIKKI